MFGIKKETVKSTGWFLAVVGLAIAGMETYGGWSDARTAARLDGALPAEVRTFRTAPRGTPVVAEGIVQPGMERLARGLSIYTMETYRKAYSSSDTQSTSSWHEDDRHTPAFSVITASGVVKVVDTGYEIDRGALHEEGETTWHARRFRGFAPGDSVLVFGTVGEGGIDADHLFAGTRDEYRAFLTEGSAGRYRNAQLIAVASVSGMALLVLFRRGLVDEPEEEAAANAEAEEAV